MMELLTVHLLFFLSALQIACQAPPSPSVVGTTVKSLPNPLVIPWANVNYTCTTSTTWLPNAFGPTWIPETFSPSDCAEAIAKFHDIEVTPKRDTVYEFIRASAPQSRPYYYGQATPRQYISGNCAMGIVNMNDSRLGNLVPEMFSKVDAYAADDISTYTDIWRAAKQLHGLCTTSYGVPGWIAIGDASSTGVFLYASNSTIAETINATEPDTRISAHLPPNWNYLGCNYDTSNVALKNLSWAGDMLSLERCAEYCTHYRYFGVKAGRECHCGRDLNPYSAIGGEAACNVSCNGLETEFCGGVSAISVYKARENGIVAGDIQVDEDAGDIQIDEDLVTEE